MYNDDLDLEAWLAAMKTPAKIIGALLMIAIVFALASCSSIEPLDLPSPPPGQLVDTVEVRTPIEGEHHIADRPPLFLPAFTSPFPWGGTDKEKAAWANGVAIVVEQREILQAGRIDAQAEQLEALKKDSAPVDDLQ